MCVAWEARHMKRKPSNTSGLRSIWMALQERTPACSYGDLGFSVTWRPRMGGFIRLADRSAGSLGSLSRCVMQRYVHGLSIFHGTVRDHRRVGSFYDAVSTCSVPVNAFLRDPSLDQNCASRSDQDRSFVHRDMLSTRRISEEKFPDLRCKACNRS